MAIIHNEISPYMNYWLLRRMCGLTGNALYGNVLFQCNFLLSNPCKCIGIGRWLNPTHRSKNGAVGSMEAHPESGKGDGAAGVHPFTSGMVQVLGLIFKGLPTNSADEPKNRFT